MAVIRTSFRVAACVLSLLGLITLAGCGGNPDTSAGPLNVGQLTGTQGLGGTGGGTGEAIVLGTAVAGAPVAEIRVSATLGIAPLTVRLDGTGSRAATGQIVRYQWDFGDGQVAVAPQVFHTYVTPGVYVAGLTVFDEEGQSGFAQVQIVILAPVQIVCTPGTSGPAPLSVSFGVAIMGGGDVLPIDVGYRWRFGDGTEGTGLNVVHVYERPGQYTVTLIFVVGTLLLQGDQVDLTVHEPAGLENKPPVAVAGADVVFVDTDGDGLARVDLDGSASYDPDGRIVWYRWSREQAPEQAGILAEGSTPRATATLTVGEHQITLTVIDDRGATGRDTVAAAVLSRAALSVAPAEGFSSQGQIGGTFAPDRIVYTLTNAGQQALEWSVSCNQDWLVISQREGSLLGGAAAAVTISIQATPDELGAGSHSGLLAFTNRTNGVGSASRAVQLTVTDAVLRVVSGHVTENGSGLSDVVMEGLPGNPRTDDAGYYQANVPLGWSGVVLPTKVDYDFDPPSRRYTDVAADQVDQDYVATAVVPLFADRISQYGITWFFDRSYRVGQFVNGDWWVCPDTPGGTVTVVGVSPSWTGLKNGSVLDMDGASSGQGFSNINGVNWAYDASLRVEFPLQVRAAETHSLISTIGRDTENPGGANQVLLAAAILTIVPRVPHAGTFRPAYMGPKTLHRWGSVRLDMLPNLPVPEGVALPQTSSMARPWLTAIPGAAISMGRAYLGACIHPEENMPPYPRDSALVVSNYACAVLLDSANRDVYVTQLIQLGIDLYGVHTTSINPIWGGAGFGSGWKFPIVFAGVMLGDPNMAAPQQVVGGAFCFQEDSHTYMSYSYSPPRAMWGADAPTYGYNVYGWCFQNFDFRDPNGIAEVEPPPGYPELIGYTAGGVPVKGSYRLCCSSHTWVGEALCARVLGMQRAWNHEAWFDYVDRWVADSYGAMNVYGSVFVQRVWEAYRDDY